MIKLLSIGIILLFVGLSISSSTGLNVDKVSTTAFDGKTLYVGGSGPGNYTKIQDAIDNASDGDTVFVYSGIYYENLIINKTINLKGENKSSTNIFGDEYSDTIYIYANCVNISGFTINKSKIFYTGIIVYSNNNSIMDNNISVGIVLHNSNENEIYFNNFQSKWETIAIENSKFNKIHNNTLKGYCNNGISLEGSNENSIYFNKIYSHLNYFSGISLRESDLNNISYNIINNNSYGIELLSSNRNKIVHNVISNNQKGIFLLESYFNIIKYNNFKKNIGIISFYYWMFDFPFFNLWNNNYWDRPRFLPKTIFGFISPSPVFFPRIPLIQFDWDPAKKPYKIEECKLE